MKTISEKKKQINNKNNFRFSKSFIYKLTFTQVGCCSWWVINFIESLWSVQARIEGAPERWMNNKVVVVVVVVETRRDAYNHSRRDALRSPSQLNHRASRRSCNRFFLKDMRDQNWVRSLFFNCFIITGRVERGWIILLDS